MQNNEFEKQVQQKMEELHLSPADAVWENIEAALPGEKRKHRWWFLLFTFLVLSTGLFIFLKFNSGKKSNQLSVAENISAAPPTAAQNKKADSVVIPYKNFQHINSDSTDAAFTNTADKIAITSRTEIKITKAAAEEVLRGLEESAPLKKDKSLYIKGATKVKIKAPDSGYITEVTNNEKTEEINSTGSSATVSNVTEITALNDSIITTVKINDSEGMVVKQNDTLSLSASTKSNIKKVENKWQYGFEFSTGNAKIKNSLFSNQSVYSDVRFFNQVGSISTGSVAAPGSPKSGIAYTFGFYTEKNLNPKWSLKTGLRYAYQYNNLQVGKRTDSASNFTFEMNKSIAATNYYSTGNTNTYKNQFHLLELPIQFGYKIFKNHSVYAEAGSSIAYLLNSNALVYSSSARAYITNPGVFNKLLLSFNAGVSVDILLKRKFAFNIGYSYKYNASSVTQKAYGKQYLANSLLYLKIPVKK